MSRNDLKSKKENFKLNEELSRNLMDQNKIFKDQKVNFMDQKNCIKNEMDQKVNLMDQIIEKKEKQIDQINRILFMNLKQFERESKIVMSNLHHENFVPVLSEENDQRWRSINSNEYIHQKYPSFLDDDDSFSERILSSSSGIEVKSNSELSSSQQISIAKISPLVLLYESRPAIPNSSNFFVVKLSNVADDITQEDIDQFAFPIPLIHGHRSPYFTETVHIIFETKSESKSHKSGSVFIEFPTEDLANEFLAKIKARPVLQKKMVDSTLTSQEILLEYLFRKFKIETCKSDIENGHIYVSKNQITELIRHCRKKVESNRAYMSLERAIQSIISILSKVPWHLPHLLSTLQRDHLFELSKLSVEAIVNQPLKIRTRYLEKLVLAALCVPLFTEKQKTMILTSAPILIPREMLLYVYVSDENLCLHKPGSNCLCENEKRNDVMLNESKLKESEEIALLRSESEEIHRNYQNSLIAFEELQLEYNNLLEHYQIVCQMKSNQPNIVPENLDSQLQTPPQSAKNTYFRFQRERGDMFE